MHQKIIGTYALTVWNDAMGRQFADFPKGHHHFPTGERCFDKAESYNTLENRQQPAILPLNCSLISESTSVNFLALWSSKYQDKKWLTKLMI